MSTVVRLKLKAFDAKILEDTVKSIVDMVGKTGGNIKALVPLPTKITRYTVLRSPHVNKKSREQFEMRMRSRLIDIDKVSPQTTDALTRLSIPSGVDITIKL